MSYARESQAMELAPNFWLQAQTLFQNAETRYHDREYDEARTDFFKARRLAEKAENISRLKRFQSGEGSL